jgi:hypothetical protein
MTESRFMYANGVAAGHSEWEVTYVFNRNSLQAAADAAGFAKALPGTAATFPVGGAPPAERFEVSLSGAHAKIFGAIALKTALQYERLFGPFKLSVEQQQIYESELAAIREYLDLK